MKHNLESSNGNWTPKIETKRKQASQLKQHTHRLRCVLSKEKWDILENWINAGAVNHIIFVDGDNVQLIWDKMIPNLIPQETIFIFCGNENTNICPEKLQNRLKIWVYDDIVKEKNSADIAMAYLFGRLDHISDASIRFDVISGDKGFQALETKHLVRQWEGCVQRQIQVIDSHGVCRNKKGKAAKALALTKVVCSHFLRGSVEAWHRPPAVDL